MCCQANTIFLFHLASSHQGAAAVAVAGGWEGENSCLMVFLSLVSTKDKREVEKKNDSEGL